MSHALTKALLLSTTGTGADPLPFPDLGLRSFPHPTVDYNLLEEYSEEELRFSRDLQNALIEGWITLKDIDGNVITDSTRIGMHEHVLDELPGMQEQYTAEGEPTGFPNRTASSISFTDGTRTFRILPTAGEFDYYINGVRYVKDAPQDKIISADEGIHFLYFDGDTLEETTVFDISIIYSKAFVAVVYWDATNNKHIYLGDERHGMTMDGQTHAHFHLTRGTAWISGLALSDITPDQNGSLDAHAQLGYTQGEIRDEDLSFPSPSVAKPAPIPVFTRDGASGNWRVYATTLFPVRQYLGNPANRLSFNSFAGGVWAETEVTNGNYVLAHLFATNDALKPVIAVHGQAQYATVSLARAGANVELNNLVTAGLPFVEFTPLGTVIFQTGNGGGNNYTNSVHARIVSTDLGAPYVDFRTFTFASTGSTNDHGNLAGLADDDHPQYMGRYQRQEDLTESTTTSNVFQDKVTLITGSLTGRFRIGYSAKMKNDDKAGEAQLYNDTDAAVFGGVHGIRTKQVNDEYQTISGAYEIVLTGVSKTIKLQWRDKVGGQTQYIRDAFIEFWRVNNV